MPVVYRCPECGQTHTAPVAWASREEFESVLWNREVGAWDCENRLRAGRRIYIQAHLDWVSEYEVADWDELQRMLRAAQDAVRQRRPGAWSELEEIEEEVAARRFRVVARYPWKRVVWAAFRTRAECEHYLRWAGVRAGSGHEHDGAKYEVVVEEAG